MAPARRTLLLALVLLGSSCAGVSEPIPTLGPGPSAPATGTTSPATGDPATSVAVFDGDTLLASLGDAEEKVRLLGINAPERDECFGDKSQEAAAALLARTPLLVEAGDRDQFDRLLAYAYAGGVLVNRALVEDGYALALATDHPRLAEFLAAEEAAYAGGRGMWAPGACGIPSPARLRLRVEADPAGPDEDDLNAERVLVNNEGTETVDLSGWVLRDESSQNRYRFPDAFFLAAGASVAVHTGSGEDGPADLYWGSRQPVWNNGGDSALLLDPAGNVAARLRYPG